MICCVKYFHISKFLVQLEWSYKHQIAQSHSKQYFQCNNVWFNLATIDSKGFRRMSIRERRQNDTLFQKQSHQKLLPTSIWISKSCDIVRAYSQLPFGVHILQMWRIFSQKSKIEDGKVNGIQTALCKMILRHSLKTRLQIPIKYQLRKYNLSNSMTALYMSFGLHSIIFWDICLF